MKKFTAAMALLGLTALAPLALLGATFTINDPSCTGFSLSGAPPNQVISCTGVPTPQPPPPPPVVTPPSPDNPLARFDAAPSDWARWTFWQSSEFAPLQARIVARSGEDPGSVYTRINQQINAYGSTIRVYGRREGNNYWCLTLPGPTLVADVGGACDAYVRQRFPGVVPGPLR